MAWKSKDADLFKGTSAGASQAPRCYESHPSLKFGKGRLYGGSAAWPVRKADIYVSLQRGSTCGCTSDPWEPQSVVEIHFGVSDMHAPEDVARFKKMIGWLAKQITHGKKVHVGCIGGHGRTGTVLSALVAVLLKEKDAIQWVRKHYCAKAVESTAQVDFLVKHYGVSRVPGHKTGASSHGASPSAPWANRLNAYTPPLAVSTSIPPASVTSTTRTYVPLASSRSIWRLPR